ncbi:TonB-dependent siderophore receptor [Thalassospira profundimaris]|uniref:Ferrioxamine B receptor n=1 Tax=Thalassospira profundimaris TaxID=502049 RepID=A0A367WPE0_9PROT|nr:TonB-dependent siderophore receptor [Thalassospira profundimaris]RCK43345.1 ferrioxamine B receptor [Thalassospira profundimaris]
MRRLAATTVISGIALACPLSGNAAEIGTAEIIGAEIAQSNVVLLNIPAQDLDRALTTFADQANLKLMFPSDGLGDVKVSGLKGEMTVDAALGTLLSGSGYTWRYTDGGTITIEQLATSGENVTDAVRVEANSVDEKADGPVPGYIATKSLAATKTATPILETSQSITVVTRDQMEDQGSQTIMQAMRYTPGAFTGQVGASNRYDYVILRGLVDRSIDNIYLDGLKTMSDDSTYSSMQVDPYFVERADVVKGPASVLYGRSSPGGLVALSSKKPQFEQQGEVELSYGNRNQRGVGFDLTGPLDEAGKLAYRLVGKADAADTQFEGAEEERYAISPSLTTNFTDDTRVTLMAYLQKDPEGGTHNGVPSEGTLFPRNGKYISTGFFDGDPSLEAFERTQNMVGYQFEHDFDETFTARQNFRFLDADVHIDQIYQTGWVGSTDELKRSYGGGDETMRAYAVDNQLQADFATSDIDHTVLMGFDYQHRRTENSWQFPSASNINPFSPTYGSPGVTLGAPTTSNVRTLEQAGLYLEDQFSYENWRLSLGLRQDWVETTKLDRLTNKKTGEDRQKLTKRAGILYLFDNGVAPYVSYSESFNPSLSSDVAGNPIEPSGGTQYEAGVKYQPENGNLMLSAAAFYLEQDNVAIYNASTFAYDPLGKIESQGLELEARANLNENLSVIASYTYTDAAYDAPGDTKDGKRPMQVPEHMASIWGDYGFHSGALDGLSIGAGARFVGEMAGNESNTITVPDYTIFDLALNYDMAKVGFDNTDLRINVNNLLDEEYVASCLITQWSDNCYYGEERSILATLRYRF